MASNKTNESVFYLRREPEPAFDVVDTGQAKRTLTWVEELAGSLAKADVVVVCVAESDVSDVHAKAWNTKEYRCKSKVELRVDWNICHGKSVKKPPRIRTTVFRRGGA